LSADPNNLAKKNQARSNLRLGLILATVALAVFIGVWVRYGVLRG